MAELFITVDELLADPDPLDIPTRKKDKDGKWQEVTLRLYPRRPTDIEKQMAMSAANGARRTLRKKLEDEKSEEHKLLLLEPLEDSPEAALRNIWVNGNLMVRALELNQTSLEEREVVDEPEGVVLPKEQDAYEEAAEGAEMSRVEQLTIAIENARKELEAEVKAIPQKQLVQAAMPAHIETIVGQTWNEVYTANIIARCTFQDKNYRKPTFKTVADVDKWRSLKPAMYRALADTHRGLLMEQEPSLGN